MEHFLAVAVPAGFTGLAVAGLMSSPAEQLGRIVRSGRYRGPGQSPRSETRLIAAPAILRPRPDALPLRFRLLFGAAAGLVTILLGQSLQSVFGGGIWACGPIVTLVAVIATGRIEAPTARKRRQQMIFELPHLLELLAAAMAAGLPLRSAAREVVSVTDGPLSDDLATVLTNAELGSSDVDAWRSLRDHPALGRVSVDLARSVESGTMVVSTLRSNAELARRQRRGALEARAKSVGVRSVPPLMLCFAPAFVAVCIVPILVTALQNALS